MATPELSVPTMISDPFKRWLPRRGGGWHVTCANYRCGCGKEFESQVYHIKSGKKKSCGCGSSPKRLAQFNTKHGLSKTKAYKSWFAMMRRCYREKSDGFVNYGGRGITVCHEWHQFEQFYADMGEPGKGMSIDRIDNNGNYEPSNCRWATQKEQNRNQRRNRLLSIDGLTKTMAEWAEIAGISSSKVHQRLSRGWSIKDALFG
jgi:hypothetical protein